MRRLGIVLFVAGLGIGSWLDRPVDDPPAEIGGYRVIQADFHVHSFLGDGVLSPFNLVLEARRRGLHAFALTNHNQLIAARLARWFTRTIDGPVVLVGQEITSPDYHFAVAGLRRPVSWRLPPSDAIREVHEQGGIVIAAHPMKGFWPALDEEVISRLDGADVMHPLVYFEKTGRQELSEFFRRARQANPDLAAIGSSDFHALQSFGIFRTAVFVESVDEAGVLDAIRAGRTVVFDERGRAYGDAELMRLLEGGPPGAPGHDGSISIAGALAWLGLAGWLALGRR